MGLSTPIRKLFCFKCKQKYRGQFRHFSVEVIRSTGEGVQCRCRNCGHNYTTYSRAAHRQVGYGQKSKLNSR